MESKSMIKGAELWSWQNDLVKTFSKLTPDEKIVIKKCRQVGASFTFAQILFYTAINKSKSTSVYVTTTGAAARKFFQDMEQFCMNSPIVKCNGSSLEMRFFNGSIIYFKSSESQLRGLSCKNGGILVVDECAFLNSDIWTSILPFATVSHANILIASTPWFKRGMYYTFYNRALSGDSGYYLIDTKNYDLSMFINDEQKAEYKKILSPNAYKTEIEGEFMDSGNGIFGDFYDIIVRPSNDNLVYAGLDFAVSIGGDDLALVGFNDLKEETLVYTDNQTQDPTDRITKIAEIINNHPECKKIVAETNSMGSTMISILKSKLRNPNIIEMFTTTNTSKKDVIESLIANVGSKKIKLMNNDKQTYELEIYQLQELKNGNYTYNADTKAFNSHDDIVMALAFANRAMDDTKGKYIIR